MALIALRLWVVAAWGLMVSLSARRSWTAAHGLAAAGAPIAIWLGVGMGWAWALLGAAVMALVLRRPLGRFDRWLGGLPRRGVSR